MFVRSIALVILFLSAHYSCAAVRDNDHRYLEQDSESKSEHGAVPMVKVALENEKSEPLTELASSGSVKADGVANQKNNAKETGEKSFEEPAVQNVNNPDGKRKDEAQSGLSSFFNTILNKNGKPSIDANSKADKQASEGAKAEVEEIKKNGVVDRSTEQAEPNTATDSAGKIYKSERADSKNSETITKVDVNPAHSNDPIGSTGDPSGKTLVQQAREPTEQSEGSERTGEIRTATGGFVHTLMVVLTVFAFLSNGAFLIHVFWFSK